MKHLFRGIFVLGAFLFMIIGLFQVVNTLVYSGKMIEKELQGAMFYVCNERTESSGCLILDNGIKLDNIIRIGQLGGIVAGITFTNNGNQDCFFIIDLNSGAINRYEARYSFNCALPCEVRQRIKFHAPITFATTKE